jgi:hypothetical protein
VRLFAALIIFLFVVSPSLGANVKFSLSAEGIGTISTNSDKIWESGSNIGRVKSTDQYTGGSAGHITLTAPGDFQYQTVETIDASVNNRYTGTEYQKFQNGGVTSTSISMDDNTPNQSPIACTASEIVAGNDAVAGGTPLNQWVDGQYTGIFQDVEMDNSKFVNDANVSISSETRYDGYALYTGHVASQAEVGGDKNKTTENYKSYTRDSFTFTSNATGGGIVRPEFSFTDFSDAFVANSSSNLTHNETEVNQT